MNYDRGTLILKTKNINIKTIFSFSEDYNYYHNYDQMI